MDINEIKDMAFVENKNGTILSVYMRMEQLALLNNIPFNVDLTTHAYVYNDKLDTIGSDSIVFTETPINGEEVVTNFCMALIAAEKILEKLHRDTLLFSSELILRVPKGESFDALLKGVYNYIPMLRVLRTTEEYIHVDIRGYKKPIYIYVGPTIGYMRNEAKKIRKHLTSTS